MIIAIVAASGFHIGTLEEYYVGGCYLGMFNAVSDGSVGIILLLLTLSIFGNNFVTGLLPFVKPYIIVQGMVIWFLSIKYMFNHASKELKPGDVTGMPLVVKQLGVQVLGYLLTMTLLCLVGTIGPEPVWSRPESAPFFCLVTLQCFVTGHLTWNVQVLNVTKWVYSPFKNRLNLFVIATSLMVLVLGSVSSKQYHADHVVQFLLFVSFIA